jgi:hypothetical protein
VATIRDHAKAPDVAVAPPSEWAAPFISFSGSCPHKAFVEEVPTGVQIRVTKEIAIVYRVPQISLEVNPGVLPRVEQHVTSTFARVFSSHL